MKITTMRIGVLAGGTSAEREVSLRSGSAVYSALTALGYDTVFVDVGHDVCEALRREKVEVAFLALHGGFGEDGGIQGLLEVLGIPYTGSGVLASALAMDKEASKKAFLHHGLKVAPYVVLRKSDLLGGARFRVGFPMPWVVKPATEGSSIGVTIVKQEAALAPAIEAAFSYGERVMVERYVKGKEIQIGILGDHVLGGVEVRPAREFYSYEAKYTPGLTEYIVPPAVDGATYETLKQIGLRAHKALNCNGATRVDLIHEDGGETCVLEVNTIPGMTETSLLPKIARLGGFDFPQLVEKMVQLSLGDG